MHTGLFPRDMSLPSAPAPNKYSPLLTQISREGYPFVGVSLADWKNVSAILADIHNILRQPPNPDPRTWVNKEAAQLYFNDGEKGREEYARCVRRCAQRSMED